MNDNAIPVPPVLDSVYRRSEQLEALITRLTALADEWVTKAADAEKCSKELNVHRGSGAGDKHHWRAWTLQAAADELRAALGITNSRIGVRP